MTINVDSDTCTRCGICSEICPLSIIGQVDEETLPRVAEGISGMCISCGHCEAFCPTEALTQSLAHESRTGSQGEACGEISPDKLGVYLKSRRSIRKYQPEPVGNETIEALLDVARQRPGATASWSNGSLSTTLRKSRKSPASLSNGCGNL